MRKVDLHLHSDYSDGSDTVQELVKNIVTEGLSTFALTDHDTISGCVEIQKYLPQNVNFISGCELTSICDTVKSHILGYYCDPFEETLTKLIEKGRKLRRAKLEKRIQFLKDVWNIELTKAELDWLYSRNSVVKIHLGNILVERGLAKDNIEAMKKYLDGCKTGKSRFDGDESIAAIVASGGIPVWAHPLGGEGEIHLEKDEFFKRLDVMKSFGIRGLECYYSRYNEEEIEFLVDVAKQNDLLISGGSDYHGANKTVKLAQLNVDNEPICEENLSIIKNSSILLK